MLDGLCCRSRKPIDRLEISSLDPWTKEQLEKKRADAERLSIDIMGKMKAGLHVFLDETKTTFELQQEEQKTVCARGKAADFECR